MTERRQADITDQQIKGAGEQCEAQRLHQKDRIEEKRRHNEKYDHQRNGDAETCIAVAAARERGRIENALGHAVRPNKPAGRTSSTIAMMTKITVFEASG